MNLALYLQRAAAVSGARPAIAVGDRVHASYGEFARRTAERAGLLARSHGVAPGTRVGIFAHNCAEYLEALYAVWHAGAVAVPINAKLHEREAAYILQHSGAVLCLADAEHRDALAQLPAEERGATRLLAFEEEWAGGEPLPLVARAPDDLAWLFYTSGTTGRPKGVMLSHRNLQLATLCYLAQVNPTTADDALLHAAPLSHGSGIYNFGAVWQGAVQVIPREPHFDPAAVFQLIAAWRGTSFFAAPTMVKRLVAYAREHRPPLDNLNTIIYGGGPMYLADIEEALAVMGPRFAQIYGQGESPMTITVLPKQVLADRAHPRYRERLASVGYAQPVVELAIRSAEGRELPPGEIGEVCVRGDVVMAGYWNNPQATAETLRDGWLHTGDVGVLDEDGFLTLKDRSKDLIISGGTNIYPREVEEALLTCPGVREVSVVGVPDVEWGESVLAYVVAEPGVTPEQLDAHCLERIARFKRPKHYRFVAELPKNNYGKVLKTELRLWARREFGGDRNDPENRS